MIGHNRLNNKTKAFPKFGEALVLIEQNVVEIA